jgi:hypothetical protein
VNVNSELKQHCVRQVLQKEKWDADQVDMSPEREGRLRGSLPSQGGAPQAA